jgi:hypothetical protein
MLPTNSGVIVAQLGTDSDALFASITSITIGGSVVGSGPTNYAQIFSDGDIGPVKIGGDLRGGAGNESGLLLARKNLGLVSIGGSVVGSSGTDSGTIASYGKLDGVKIGGSLVGSGGQNTGQIYSAVATGPVTIFGDFIGGAGNGAGKIHSLGVLGAISIGGDVLAGANGLIVIAASNGNGLGNNTHLGIKSVTIGGSATRLFVFVNAPDAIIGPVKVGGDWREGAIFTNIDSGDGVLGNNDDVELDAGDPLLFSKIASITIGGAVIGTASTSGDSFGFVAQEIGALSIGGTKIPLLPGHGTDTNATLSRYIISASRDFTVHEVA